MTFSIEATEAGFNSSLRDRNATPDNFDRVSYYEDNVLVQAAARPQVMDGPFLLCGCMPGEDKPADKPDEKPKPKERPKDVEQKTIDDYVKSFENLHKNGACTKESLDAFKETVKSLPTMDAKGLEESLKKAIANSKVDTALVMQHIKEVLQSSGYIQIDGGAPNKPNEGGLFMKHPKTEVYAYMVYKKDKDKSDARVEIERKKD